MKNLYEELGRDKVADLCGRDWRLLSLSYRKIYGGCVEKERWPSFCIVMDTWSQIQHILYLPSKVSTLYIFITYLKLDCLNN